MPGSTCRFFSAPREPNIARLVSRECQSSGQKRGALRGESDFRCAALRSPVVWRAAVSNAVDYAKFRSRSHYAVIRVFDESGSERMRILPEGDATGAVAESGVASVVVYPLELA